MSDLRSFLPAAVRAWTVRPEDSQRHRRVRRHQRPPPAPDIRHALIIDTETSTDPAQRLLFGAFRYARLNGTAVTTVAEGLIHPDDLPETDPDGYVTLRDYAPSRKANVDLGYLSVEPEWALRLLSLTQFADRFLYRVGYKRRRDREPAVIVMFNAPFDWSRLATGAGEARDDLAGGFSFLVWTNPDGAEKPWRPRVAIKVLDSKRALKKFRRLERGGHDFAGHLLDLRTLVFALTGASHSLDSACAAFGVPGKAEAPDFGRITVEAVDYCREDVAATTRLYQAVMAEYARHPIGLQATQAYSPASIAKAYLKAQGIRPRLQLQPDFSPELLGAAMSAFYGGRAEIHHRHVPLPVRLVDVTSMYPTVDVLLQLWPLITAERVEPVDVTDEIGQLLATVAVDDCYQPHFWERLVVLVQIRPDGDIVPVRAGFTGDQDGTWSIGVNPLHADLPMWFTLPDLIDSVLRSGRIPTVLRAVRFTAGPMGQPNLLPVRLRGQVGVDPIRDDFFARVVEERQHIKATTRDHAGSCRCPDCSTAAFLKVLANSGSYGILAEMIRHELGPGARETVTVYGPAAAGRPVAVHAPEDPGEFCFPPLAAVITGAARLILAVIERAVTDLGGTWVFCDTDSMAIVATHTGGLIPCPGGDHTLPDSTPAVLALSYAQVDQIRARIKQLNPYTPGTVPELLKIDTTGIATAISAKHYVITDADSVILKRSLHGLGRYLDPVTLDRERRDTAGNPIWIDEAWAWILASLTDPDAAMPDWVDRPALSRITVSSTILWRPFERWNEDRPWAEQIKPFNFLLVATIDPFGYPPGADPTRFRLIAPYNPDPRTWIGLDWRNLYDPDGPTYRITTDKNAPVEPDLVIVRSYRDILLEHRNHPEHKFNGPDGQPCRRSTRGQLQHRPVHAAGPLHLIGKEANRLEDVHAGIVGSLDEVLTDYTPTSEEWFRQYVLPVLDRYSGRPLAALTGVDRRTIDRVRRGVPPRAELRAALTELAAHAARKELNAICVTTPAASDIAVLTAWRHDSPQPHS